MATKRKPRAAAPTPGQPRPCKTGEACGTLFTPGKDGWGDHCARCQAALKDGREPGPRERETEDGKQRKPVKVYLRPELLALVNADLLKSFNVKNASGLASLALAKMLGKENLK